MKHNIWENEKHHTKNSKQIHFKKKKDKTERPDDSQENLMINWLNQDICRM